MSFSMLENGTKVLLLQDETYSTWGTWTRIQDVFSQTKKGRERMTGRGKGRGGFEIENSFVFQVSLSMNNNVGERKGCSKNIDHSIKYENLT